MTNTTSRYFAVFLAVLCAWHCGSKGTMNSAPLAAAATDDAEEEEDSDKKKSKKNKDKDDDKDDKKSSAVKTSTPVEATNQPVAATTDTPSTTPPADNSGTDSGATGGTGSTPAGADGATGNDAQFADGADFGDSLADSGIGSTPVSTTNTGIPAVEQPAQPSPPTCTFSSTNPYVGECNVSTNSTGGDVTVTLPVALTPGTSLNVSLGGQRVNIEYNATTRTVTFDDPLSQGDVLQISQTGGTGEGGTAEGAAEVDATLNRSTNTQCTVFFTLTNGTSIIPVNKTIFNNIAAGSDVRIRVGGSVNTATATCGLQVFQIDLVQLL